ncbi:pyridoxamine 5'-phosphate oxidase family protein [SAR92 clade bacterium H455]|uniref:Pyridoxamine 5'-phosphate oxidase family protein n=1 Tax=SAR92 clade bacterium H455 TaxID=2974818 RepID=A0ABY5TUE8_9GAMM|nr:pyridoxamine 5'-phosphate oxidase family protein [SAR92 clade bacterium H455]
MAADTAPLKAFLQAESVLTLSVNDDQGPWTAPVLYVADEDLNLYFLSSSSTRHIASLPEDNRIAASIYSDYKGDWLGICGVQMEAHISQVDETDRAAAAARYFQRFPEVKALIDNPANEQEQRIGAAFGKSHFFRVTPTCVRFINNADGFSSRNEWRF